MVQSYSDSLRSPALFVHNDPVKACHGSNCVGNKKSRQEKKTDEEKDQSQGSFPIRHVDRSFVLGGGLIRDSGFFPVHFPIQ